MGRWLCVVVAVLIGVAMGVGCSEDEQAAGAGAAGPSSGNGASTSTGPTSSGGQAGMPGQGGGGAAASCFVDIDAANYHTCAVKRDGTLWCWGGNGAEPPIEIVAAGNSTAWVEVEGGSFHTCARKADGTLWCWGRNESGECGDGTNDAMKTAPVQVTALGTNVVKVAAAGFNSCALLQDGSVWCWGDNGGGMLGNTSGGISNTPVQLPAFAAPVVDLNVGCARLQDNTLWCWGPAGLNGNGIPGGQACPNGPCHPSPVQHTALGNQVAWARSGCARKLDGTMWCWGQNDTGQLGDGTLNPSVPPVEVTALAGQGLELDQVGGGRCAFKEDGTAWCWGRNGGGELGDGTVGGQDCGLVPCKPSPVQVSGLTGVLEITGGVGHSCARRDDDTLWCWGQNGVGQLGDGTATGQTCLCCPMNVVCKPEPVQVMLPCP